MGCLQGYIELLCPFVRPCCFSYKGTRDELTQLRYSASTFQFRDMIHLRLIVYGEWTVDAPSMDSAIIDTALGS
jgi:hypothetical protein